MTAGAARPRRSAGKLFGVPRSRLARILLTLFVLGVAVALLALGALYQDDTSPEVFNTGQAANPMVGTAPGEPASPGTRGAVPVVDPVEGWYPQGGQAAACTEGVGVDLAPGYRASLTINGVPIPDDQLNDPESAAATLNRYTWGPERDCPRGEILRPEANVLEACVWRIGEPASTCRPYRFTFDAL